MTQPLTPHSPRVMEFCKQVMEKILLNFLIRIYSSGVVSASVHLSGVPRGGRGGHGPRAQDLEGAPAQLVGANFKSRAMKGPAFLMH